MGTISYSKIRLFIQVQKITKINYKNTKTTYKYSLKTLHALNSLLVSKVPEFIWLEFF